MQGITIATDGTFHQAYSYKDALGNFNGIFRNDLVKTSGNWAIQNIDDNAYFYQNPLSSKISSILDYTGSQLGYKANSGTYTYDANGNTTYDPANKISTVYNYLNLPSKFTKDDGTRQELVYDFSGKKWQENEYLANSNLLSKRSYLGSFEFEGNSLQKVFNSSGFIQNLAADVSSGGQTNGNITGSNIVSTQKLKSGVKSEYIADKSICLLPGFESLPTFNAEIKPLAGYQWNYILKDHLGNTRVLFTDKNNDGFVKQDTDESQNEVLSLSNYSPFGLELGGSHQNLKQQFDYKFNGKQYNGFSGLTDFGARYLDKYLGVWGQVDPMADEYSGISPYVYVLNRPTVAIDPDGRRVYFIGGAGNDADGWNYIRRWGQAFNKVGVDFYRVNASHGKAGDVAFTNFYRSSGMESDYTLKSAPAGGGLYGEYNGEVPVDNQMINSTARLYKQQLQDNPLNEGEQFNLAGYSYGSVLQAQAALKLANDGQVIDNLVLIGSPISDKSDLWKQLNSNKNIKNIIRYDIKGDALSNPQDVYDFIKGGIQNRNDNGPHFDAARPGQQANQLIQTIIQWLQQQGVKN